MKLSIPNLAPIFLKVPHLVFQIWEIPDPENLLGALYQALRGLEFLLRAPNYEAFLKISINLRARSFSSDDLPQKLVKAYGY